MNIEELRKLCLSLPNVTEDIKWGHDLCFMVNDKMFCVTGADENPMQVSLKVRDEEFNDLIETDDIISAPYVGRFKWVLVQNAKRFNKKEWEHFITQSYELIKSKSSSKVKSARPSEAMRRREKLKVKSEAKGKSAKKVKSARPAEAKQKKEKLKVKSKMVKRKKKK